MIEFIETDTHIQIRWNDVLLINVAKANIEVVNKVAGMPFDQWLYYQLEMTPTFFECLLEQCMKECHTKYLESKK